MSREEQLVLLKTDLQMMTGAFDVYLVHLLETAEGMIRREGITLDDSVEDVSLRVMYAAYLYRKRAEPDARMPRMLRYAMNNRLMQEKVGRDVV